MIVINWNNDNVIWASYNKHTNFYLVVYKQGITVVSKSVKWASVWNNNPGAEQLAVSNI